MISCPVRRVSVTRCSVVGLSVRASLQVALTVRTRDKCTASNYASPLRSYVPYLNISVPPHHPPWLWLKVGKSVKSSGNQTQPKTLSSAHRFHSAGQRNWSVQFFSAPFFLRMPFFSLSVRTFRYSCMWLGWLSGNSRLRSEVGNDNNASTVLPPFQAPRQMLCLITRSSHIYFFRQLCGRIELCCISVCIKYPCAFLSVCQLVISLKCWRHWNVEIFVRLHFEETFFTDLSLSLVSVTVQYIDSRGHI